MRMRLRFKLILSYLMISVVVVMTLLFTSHYLIRNQFNEYVKRNMENNMMLLATQVNLELNRNLPDMKEINWASYGLNALDNGFVLSVESPAQALLWCMECEYGEECSTMLSSIEHTMHVVDPDFAGEYMEKRFDLIQKSQIVGTLVLGHYGPYHYSSSEVAFLQIIERLFAFGAAGIMLFSVVLGFWMANRVAKPIGDVIHSTKRIAQGSYQERISYKTSTSELNELIEAVNQLGKSLDHQLQVKRMMATDYAHEFRTPLAVLRSSLEGMMDGVWEVTPQRLQSLHEEIMRLTRMIEGIDRLVEVEDKGSELNKTRFGLRSLLESLANNFSGSLHERALQLHISGEDVYIHGDADKIGQVMVNLLSNAIKYSKPNTQIDVSIKKRSDIAIIEIQDEGIGISQADLPFVFEHLYRADKSRKYDQGGSGIGLSIVKSLVQAHGGDVKMESVEGLGTKVIVELPIA